MWVYWIRTRVRRLGVTGRLGDFGRLGSGERAKTAAEYWPKIWSSTPDGVRTWIFKTIIWRNRINITTLRGVGSLANLAKARFYDPIQLFINFLIFFFFKSSRTCMRVCLCVCLFGCSHHVNIMRPHDAGSHINRR